MSIPSVSACKTTPSISSIIMSSRTKVAWFLSVSLARLLVDVDNADLGWASEAKGKFDVIGETGKPLDAATKERGVRTMA